VPYRPPRDLHRATRSCVMCREPIRRAHHNHRFCAKCKPLHVRERNEAQLILAIARRVGFVASADACERCDSTHWVEAHHPDYSRPLDVIYLCRRCHRNEHERTARERRSA
jgi:hypothetical protein